MNALRWTNVFSMLPYNRLLRYVADRHLNITQLPTGRLFGSNPAAIAIDDKSPMRPSSFFREKTSASSDAYDEPIFLEPVK
jgi:hypothetical protein